MKEHELFILEIEKIKIPFRNPKMYLFQSSRFLGMLTSEKIGAREQLDF